MNKDVKVIFLMGEPGSGKTWLFKKILDRYSATRKSASMPSIVYEKFTAGNGKTVYMLGKYNLRKFSGTDRLSMSCQPFVENFMLGILGGAILIEGDRLCNDKFFKFCRENFDFRLYHLDNAIELLQARREERGYYQSSSWIKGRATKILNLKTRYLSEKMYSYDAQSTECSFQTLIGEVES